VYWDHEFGLLGSRDHLIPHMRLSIGGPLEPSLYLERFLRYSTSNVDMTLK